jgi:hypothetical protein
MVQLMKNVKVSPESQLHHRNKLPPVKVEIEDSLEDKHAPLHKRSKLSSSTPIYGAANGGFQVPPSQYNLLDEPSPLGLRLKKSPSLLDLIQMKLSRGDSSSKPINHAKKEHKNTAPSSSMDKLKASNFPASLLKIGTWEYKSRYEGDLVAKCYFAKHKLVWEVLDGGLKNKIEIQWSDIVALKATYPEDAPGTLDVVLARQPLFFRETNPQPRKHTLWQATSDFTNGQASINRRHFVQCPQGLLGKHFEKLVQCDPRLNYLSQQPEITVEKPYFEPKVAVFDDSIESSSGYDLQSEEGPTVFDLQDPTSPSCAQSSSKNERQDLVSRPPRHFPHESPSPSSVVDNFVMEGVRNGGEGLKNFSSWDLIKVPGFHPSMSMSDLVNHIENQISEHKSSSNNPNLTADDRESLEILEEISRCLFTDSQHALASDEKSIMSRVNSLCCLLQKEPVTLPDLPAKTEHQETEIKAPSSSAEANDGCKPGMVRNDSVGDLLLDLPRIASLPRFFFNYTEDYDRRAR